MGNAGLTRHLVAGAAAGAAGTTALNTVSHLDMAVRGRSAGSLPEEAAGVLADLTDPRTWGVAGWVGDAVPYLGYALATVATFDLMRPRRR
ncbi:hypothetical protein [Spongiactinospora sp. TRM90649]|uniref:hypothetical protein n=1 Tax=Spongiactinospora sp. TRM90649 TaxID=3031114 RepID=UPI0023F65FF8|nr:hypothetical protein [Spongiactinospora sp. TRM90649]MDF5753246.1 hypothetical protein [Spongiactinospora sp. TRM90649]